MSYWPLLTIHLCYFRKSSTQILKSTWRSSWDCSFENSSNMSESDLCSESPHQQISTNVSVIHMEIFVLKSLKHLHWTPVEKLHIVSHTYLWNVWFHPCLLYLICCPFHRYNFSDMQIVSMANEMQIWIHVLLLFHKTTNSNPFKKCLQLHVYTLYLKPEVIILLNITLDWGLEHMYKYM